MHIGKYKITSIVSDRFGLDGGAMFGIIPKPLWTRSTTCDDKNRIPLSARNLLLQGDGKVILFDTGMGLKWDDKARDMYAIEQPPGGLKDALATEGLTPEDVTDIILTHLHFDHTGGSTILENGKIRPAFPNARYHAGETNFTWGKSPSDRDRGSYIKENFIPLVEEGVLFLHGDEWNFDDTISVITLNGHTFGHQAIQVKDSSSSLIMVGDLMPTSAHIPLPYIMGYDLQPLVTLQEKKDMLKKAVEENIILVFGHDPLIAGATVQQTEKGITIKEKISVL